MTTDRTGPAARRGAAACAVRRLVRGDVAGGGRAIGRGRRRWRGRCFRAAASIWRWPITGAGDAEMTAAPARQRTSAGCAFATGSRRRCAGGWRWPTASWCGAASTLFALPQHAADGARAIWGTADAIWTALGDTSRRSELVHQARHAVGGLWLDRALLAGRRQRRASGDVGVSGPPDRGCDADREAQGQRSARIPFGKALLAGPAEADRKRARAADCRDDLPGRFPILRREPDDPVAHDARHRNPAARRSRGADAGGRCPCPCRAMGRS